MSHGLLTFFRPFCSLRKVDRTILYFLFFIMLVYYNTSTTTWYIVQIYYTYVRGELVNYREGNLRE